MPYFYKIDTEHGVVLSTASERFSHEDFRSHQEKLARDPAFDPHYAQIADFTHVTQFDLSEDEIWQMAQGSIFDAHSRRAILASNEEGYGYARRYELVRESAGATGIRVFRSLDDALEWVLTKRKGA